MAKSFNVEKSWTLTFDVLLPSAQANKDRLLFFWGDDHLAEGAIAVQQAGARLEAFVTDCHIHKSQDVAADLTNLPTKNWMNVTLCYLAPSRELELFIDGKLVANALSEVIPAADGDMKVWLGGSNAKSARFGAKLRNLRLGNLPVPGSWNHLAPFDSRGVKEVDDFIRIDPKYSIFTKDNFSGPIHISAVARTESRNIRLYAFNGASVIFNWEINPSELRVTRPGAGFSKDAFVATASVKPLLPNTWYKIDWRIAENGMTIKVDDKTVYTENREYDLSGNNGQVSLATYDSRIDLKYLSVERLSKENDKKSEPALTTLEITPDLLKKKFGGKADYDDKTGTLNLAYTFGNHGELTDFDMTNTRVIPGRAAMNIQPGGRVRHLVKFKEVKIKAVVIVKSMNGKLLMSTGGPSVGFAGENPHTLYLELGKRRAQAFAPEKDQTGMPMRFSIFPSQVHFALRDKNLSVPAKDVKAGFIEFFGGEFGNSFGQLEFSGKIDDDWARSFFADAGTTEKKAPMENQP